MAPEETRDRVNAVERCRRERIDRLYAAIYRGRIDAPPREMWPTLDGYGRTRER
jgi:hypothetical protein